jgi:hypothetical protein
VTAALGLVPPGLVVGTVLALALSHLFYAFLPYRRRRYGAVLLLTVAGVVAGQVWDWLGLPGMRLGGANVLPAVPFAVIAQPLAGRRDLRLP